ncbi:hypothetical protein C8F04DRAFT_1043331 [Mycena alexandri]|uniref:F-box domain-containing protein n=1 Tax=Mycena alexandri TaxID=1745969 RepID=A0AAD6SLW0_9AGAR|nr:hypothetical protein C8F04DRAFT_1043331 [Mycena alexandri]
MLSFPLEKELQKQLTGMGKDGVQLQFPPEIIAEIFFRCLPAEFTVPDPGTAPLVLCRICRQYREIALSTPVLWSSLWLDFRRIARSKAYLELHRTWLARAGNTPLSLSFRDHASQRLDSSDAIKSLILTIVELSGQWRNIEIQLFVRHGITALLFPIKGTLPRLEKLIIVGAQKLDNPISIADAPNLRCVSVRYHPELRLPWHQLTTFRCDAGLDASSALKLIRDSPNLLDAALFSYNIGTTPLALSLATSRHAHLECLTLAGFPGVQKDFTIFKYLEAPSLKTLRVLFKATGFRPLDVSPFLYFLSQPSLRLHTLILSHLPATPADLITCLKATPSVVHLKLKLALRKSQASTDKMRVQINTALGQFTGHPDFLPHLESLHLVFPGKSCDNGITPSAVIEMLCWRWASTGTAQLLSFRLAHGAKHNIESDTAINLHPEFWRLVGEGMSLYVGVARKDTDSLGDTSLFFTLSTLG